MKRRRRERTFPLPPRAQQAHSAKQQGIIDLLALGEGTEKGPAYGIAKASAKRGMRRKIVAVDAKKPNYTMPRTMARVSGDALKYLERLAPNSVKIVTDNFFFHYAVLGGIGDAREDAKMALALVRSPKALAAVMQRATKYVTLVRRALVPRGRFILTTDYEGSLIIDMILQGNGFETQREKLEQTVILAKGSPQAKSEARKGNAVYRITAVKPKNPEK